jgi:hypothetical protein
MWQRSVRAQVAIGAAAPQVCYACGMRETLMTLRAQSSNA